MKLIIRTDLQTNNRPRMSSGLAQALPVLLLFLLPAGTLTGQQSCDSIQLSHLLEESRNYPKAYNRYEEALNIAEASGNRHLLQRVLNTSHHYYAHIGDYERAYKLSEQLHKTKAELFEADKSRSVLHSQITFETEQLSHQNAALQVQNKIGLITGLSLILLLTFLYYLQKVRNTQQVYRLKTRICHLQLNAHFFFNILTSIQEDIYGEQKELAVTRLGNLGLLFRRVLDFSLKDKISLQEEMEFLDHYLKLQRSIYDDRFCYTIEVDDQLKDVQIPPMLIQPFVENALEHGKIYQGTDGEVHLSVEQSGNKIQVKVADNGLGIQKKEVSIDEGSKTSISTKIIRDRLKLLFGKRGILNINSGTTSGTIVSLEIPIMK